MIQDVAQVPAVVLLTADVSASAKLVWMVSQLRPKAHQADTAGAPGEAVPANTAWLSAMTDFHARPFSQASAN